MKGIEEDMLKRMNQMNVQPSMNGPSANGPDENIEEMIKKAQYGKV